MEIARVEDAIAAISRGEIVIVVDDEDRENEGDLVMAAQAATPEKIAFFLAHTSGVICAKVARYAERLHHKDRLLTPLRRKGDKGSGAFVPVSWDDALDEIAMTLGRPET